VVARWCADGFEPGLYLESGQMVGSHLSEPGLYPEPGQLLGLVLKIQGDKLSTQEKGKYRH